MVWYIPSYIIEKLVFIQILMIFKWKKIDILISLASPDFQDIFDYHPGYIFNG